MLDHSVGRQQIDGVAGGELIGGCRGMDRARHGRGDLSRKSAIGSRPSGATGQASIIAAASARPSEEPGVRACR